MIFPIIAIIVDPSALEEKIAEDVLVFLGVTTVNEKMMKILIIALMAIFFVKFLISLVFLWIQKIILSRWRLNITLQLRQLIVTSTSEMFMQSDVSIIINRVIDSIPSTMKYYLSPYLDLANNILLFLIFISIIFFINSYVVFLICFGSLFFGSVYLFIQGRFLPAITDSYIQSLSSVVSSVSALLKGYKETKIYDPLGYEKTQFESGIRRNSRLDFAIIFFQAIPSIFVEFVAVLLIFLILLLLISISSDIATAVLEFSMIVVVAVRMLPILNRSLSALSRIQDGSRHAKAVLDAAQSFAEHASLTEEVHGLHKLLSFRETIDIEHLTFTYSGTPAPVLHEVSFSVKKGEHLGIVGPSGSGKSTLVNVLLGFLTNYSGSFSIDGVPIVGQEIANMRKLVGYVDQTPFLRDATILENVAYAEPPEDADKGRALECLQAVGLWPFLSQFEDPLSYRVLSEGKILSGGQRQRLALARALYKKAEILILDEASSALDMESEAQLATLLEGLRSELTVISIAHRLSTLRNCDRILFLEDGRVSGLGTFEQLNQSNRTFRRYLEATHIQV